MLLDFISAHILSKGEAEMGQHFRSTCQVLMASAGSLLICIYEA